MEPKPKRRRRRSNDLPPEFSELLNELSKIAASFISEFDSKGPRMRQIVREFHSIAAEVRRLQEDADRRRREARDMAAAPFRNVRATWGLSLLTAPVTAVAGTVTAVSANITNMLRENESIKKVESLGTEFTRIMEPLKEKLEEVKLMCKKLEQESTEIQARRSVSDVEQLQQTLARVSQLEKRSVEVLHVSIDIVAVIGELVSLVVQVFRFTSNSEHDEKLRVSILQVAEKGQKVLDSLDGMKTELGEFSSSLSEEA